MHVSKNLKSARVVDFTRSTAWHIRLLRGATGFHKRFTLKVRSLDQLRANAARRLHLGCGNELLPGYINVDAFSPVADVKADICTLEPFADAEADLIETHHALEHLSFGQAESALRAWSRKLKVGGYLVISVPDMDACCRLWLRTPNQSRFGIGTISRMIFGSQEHEGMYHKSGYTPDGLAKQLSEVGLTVREVWIGYPHRPTPTFLTIAQRTENVRREV